jgi:hypothetical protein
LNGGGANISSELTNMNDGSLQGSGVGELTDNRESRVFRSGSDSAAGEENPFQFTKTSRKITLKHSREMVGLMEVRLARPPLTDVSQVLTEQEAKAKGYLRKLADYRLELSEIKIQVGSLCL